MKKAFIVLLAIGMLSVGCRISESRKDANDPYECLKTVKHKYPTSVVFKEKDKNFTFYVVKPNGTVLRVKTMSQTSTEITSTEVINDTE